MEMELYRFTYTDVDERVRLGEEETRREEKEGREERDEGVTLGVIAVTMMIYVYYIYLSG